MICFHEKASKYDTSSTGFSSNFAGVFAPLHVMFSRALTSFMYTILSLSLVQFCFSFAAITALQCLLSKDYGFCVNARLLLNKNRHTLLYGDKLTSYCRIKLRGGSARHALEPIYHMCPEMTFAAGKMEFRLHQSLLWFDYVAN